MSLKATTSYAGKQPFTWSYSKLKNWRVCPRKHYYVDIKKNHQELRSQALDDGDFIHKAMEERCRDGKPLPPAIQEYEAEARKALDVTPEGSIVLVEERAAIRQDFSSCGYFDKGVWLRMKIDFAKIAPVAGVMRMASLRDWKTGKVVDDSEQLALTAQWVFSKWPTVEVVTCRYIWLGNQAETKLELVRSDMADLWRGLWPELQMYEEATRSENFPPKPGRLCKNYCPVVSCEFHGKAPAR